MIDLLWRGGDTSVCVFEFVYIFIYGIIILNARGANEIRKLGIRLIMTLSLLFMLGMGTSANAKHFGLADIPEIKNKRPIHMALEAGGSADLIIPYIKKSSEKTGVPVTTESMVMTVIYPKINIEFISGTGAYNITVMKASTTNERAPFLCSRRTVKPL